MNRRFFLRGLGVMLAGPAIVRASSLMPVRSIIGSDVPLDYAELMAITRRALVPSLFVQLYQSAPALTAMLDNSLE